MWEKIRKGIHVTCDVVEFVLAIIVGGSLIVSLVLQAPGLLQMLMESESTAGFIEVLEEIMNLVVGIEFIKMLCKPNPDNVIEVLLFLVARHLIIGEHAAFDIFLSVVSIAILFLVRQLFHIVHERKHYMAKKVADWIYKEEEEKEKK